MKKLHTAIVATLITLSTQVLAEATLTSLKVKEDIVYFSTGEVKTVPSPSCMLAENSDKWSIQLNSATGKASYALLVAALADERQITVESAGDCADVMGFERAGSVAVNPQPLLKAKTGMFYLYNGNGEKLGPIAKFVDIPNGKIAYLDDNDKQRLKNFTLPKYSHPSLYYSQDNCQGDVFTNSEGVFAIKSFNNGKYYQSVLPLVTLNHRSTLQGGNCTVSIGQYQFWRLNLTSSVPVCGEAPCEIRAE